MEEKSSHFSSAGVLNLPLFLLRAPWVLSKFTELSLVSLPLPLPSPLSPALPSGALGIYIFYISQSTYWLKIYYAHQETSYFYPHNPRAAHVHIQILPSTFSGGKHGININEKMKRIKADTSSTKSYKIRHKGECRAVIPHSHTFRP